MVLKKLEIKWILVAVDSQMTALYKCAVLNSITEASFKSPACGKHTIIHHNNLLFIFC